MSPASKRKTVYAFDHVPKCAGTSLHKMFEAQDCGYLHITSPDALVTFADGILEDNTRDAYYIGGELIYGIHELLPNDFQVFYYTFLRNPTDVAYSYFRFRKKKGNFTYGSFMDYLYDNPFNSITHHFGGSPERAIARLENYDYIGFVETYTESVAELGKRIGIEFPGIEHQNKTVDRDNELMRANITGVAEASDDHRVYNHFSRVKAMADRQSSQTRLNSNAPVYSRQNRTIADWSGEGLDHGSLIERMKQQDTDSEDFLHQAGLAAKMQLNIDDDLFEKVMAMDRDYTLECLGPAQITTKYRYDRLYERYERFASRCVFDRQAAHRLRAQQVLAFLANSAYGKANGLSIELLKQAVALNTHNDDHKRALAVHLRLQGRAEEAVAVLDTIPVERRDTVFFNEYMITTQARDGASFDIGSLMTEDVAAGHYRSLKLLHDNFELSRRKLFSEMAGKRLLVVRSGPLAVLDDLIASAAELGCDVTLGLQGGLRSNPAYSGQNVHWLGDGMFNPSEDFEGRQALEKMTVDATIYLCSSFASLNSLHNFVEFFGKIPSKGGFAYPMSNMMAGMDRKSLIPMD
ncbi:tetratricopeptide repeat protein [Salidesulfovibrio brasiliensis]|uniref:tetratricopeptide repeat protein n=1 Tax=Salidesulfovibrio brasiliensis TaxID=221711 RepID=UPI0006D19A6B|nr:tetratricopeptide repeat protein [Salidesulfovibrio brasiliensis]